MPNVKISCRNVNKIYKREGTSECIHAVKDISLDIYEGEFLCIVGPSGCGKSTLLKIIAGLIPPTSGEVLFDGELVKAPSLKRVMVFQEYALFPWRTTLGNVEFGLEMMGIPVNERRRIATESIRMVGLEGFENKYPFELSGGMKQRVAIARALAVDPETLLMDEPFASVDAQTRNVLKAELLKIWEETKKTVVYVTHNVLEAVFFADRVVMLTARPGKIKDIVEINEPRIRKLSNPKIAKIREHILETIQKEVMLSLKDKLRGIDIHEIEKRII